ncbi:SDR family oxidoreductase [Mycetocola spongiae]|uniref:SDR family oxidoreductase n=1 Tax=Mycetocola spongiae TaxID=2859226 RepID=UPI001CF49793|nr:SDR family oxidoreductase [Mycetocola spongiae]UCR89039.1 SDR family oxidoreductase [Mycetocola spongiae]
MDLGIAGKTALILASSSGLGLAVAEALAAEGARVIITGRRADLVRRIAARLPGAVGLTADITGPGGAQKLLEDVARAAGDVDILVLNGPGPRAGTAASLGSEDVAGAIETLLIPQQRIVAALLPGMRERGWGRIVGIGSSGIVTPLPNLALSNIGRAALAGYLKTLASEVAADGVTVNMVLPGRINTARVAELDAAAAGRRGMTPEAVAAESRAAIPARRYGTAREFGDTAAFLCGTPASYITGVALRCDGGLVTIL